MAALTSAQLVANADILVVAVSTAGSVLGNWDASAFVTSAGNTQASVATAVVGALGLNGDLETIVRGLNVKEVLNPKTNRIIYHVPNSDELVRRFVAPLFAKSKGIDSANDPAALLTIQGNVVERMPKSDSDIYISLLSITDAQKANMKKFDERVEQIRTALSQGVAPSATSIPPGNIIPAVARNSISVFSSYPAGLQQVLTERRKSDPSNPLNAAATLNRIRISMNGGANKSGAFVGGNASKAAPLYPRFVMHGGAHPLAVMEGGAAAAWTPARGTPNPVAVLDARIKELEAQFNAATNKGLNGALANDIRGYANTVNTNIESVQKSLQELAAANAALAQYPLGVGMDANTFDAAKLNAIAAQADKINKDAAKASKQLDKLTQIKDTLEELVNKSNPAPRT